MFEKLKQKWQRKIVFRNQRKTSSETIKSIMNLPEFATLLVASFKPCTGMQRLKGKLKNDLNVSR